MDETITIVQVQKPQELAEIVRLRIRNDREHGLDETKSCEEILAFFAAGANFWLARLGELAVGYNIGLDTFLGYVNLGIYVGVEHRKQGIGTGLMREQIKYSKLRGFPEILSMISGENIASVRTLSKVGFKVTSQESGYTANLPLNHR